ncbi:hypothetical protein Psuf_001010 [Phytohabitans suffuscus]|uniref:Uncharacterized protein n=1 Tax=Phytohabitans suffuscus TaxID=624315 RepID=A0A6F8Y9Y1_9ACTN|nr:hypothetical protein Psuf_001010 [Phytohabitans suffuscus]
MAQAAPAKTQNPPVPKFTTPLTRNSRLTEITRGTSTAVMDSAVMASEITADLLDEAWGPLWAILYVTNQYETDVTPPRRQGG